jgi:hypothetical protein
MPCFNAQVRATVFCISVMVPTKEAGTSYTRERSSCSIGIPARNPASSAAHSVIRPHFCGSKHELSRVPLSSLFVRAPNSRALCKATDVWLVDSYEGSRQAIKIGLPFPSVLRLRKRLMAASGPCWRQHEGRFATTQRAVEGGWIGVDVAKDRVAVSSWKHYNFPESVSSSSCSFRNTSRETSPGDHFRGDL